MLLKPTKRDWHVVLHYSGRLISLMGVAMLVPMVTGILFAEWSSVVDFFIGAALAGGLGLILATVFPERSDVSTLQGMAIVAATWMLATVVSAVPFYLSGQYLSYLDAAFDVMSGLTTSGLSLIQDMDHTGNAVNMWRFLLQFIGGMGIVVAGLSLLVRVSGMGGGGFQLYAGEGRDERLLPNVARTTRMITVIAAVYFVIGSTALAGAFIAEGAEPVRALMHGIWVFMAAFSTGGFAPHSSSLIFYHSGLVEMVTIPLMIAGALSFGLNHALWTGDRKEILRNIEPVTFFICGVLLLAAVLPILAAEGTYPGVSEAFRKSAYQMISAQTTTGFQTIYPAQFGQEWGGFALLSIMIAMGIGTSASSTGGGIKALRIGLAFKTFIFEARRVLNPEHAVIVQRYHHFRDRVMTDAIVRNTLLILCAFLLTFFAGAGLGMIYGYGFTDALFESTSAAANVGLSAGVTSAAMPALLKLMYIVEMWAGRLEFLSIWALFGMMLAAFRGR